MQEKVKNFNDNLSIHKTPMPVSARLLDISSELGELNKEFLKATKYGTQNFEVTEDFILEYGDVLYALLSLANETNIDTNIVGTLLKYNLCNVFPNVYSINIEITIFHKLINEINLIGNFSIPSKW